MSKFCSNCGAPIADTVKVCGNCGKENPNYKEAGIGAAIPQVKLPDGTADKVKKYAPLGIAAVVVIAVIAIIVNIIAANTGAKGIISKRYKAIQKQDGKMYVSTLSETYLDWYLDRREDYDKEDYIDDQEASLESIYDRFEDEVGEKVRFSVKVLREKTKTKSQLKKWKDEYRDSSTYEELDVNNIKAVKEVKVKVTYKGSEDEDDFKTTVTLVKDKKGWRIWPD